MPCICNVKVERNDLKVRCSDCLKYFHAKCINIGQSDIDYMASNNKSFTCKSCSTKRRKSIHLNPSGTTSKSLNPASSTNISIANITALSTQSSASDTVTVINGNETEITNQLLYKELSNLKSMVSNVLSELNTMRQEKDLMSKRIVILENKVNLYEQERKRNFIDIIGIPDIQPNSAREKLFTLINIGLDEQIRDDEIEFCYVKQTKNTFSQILSDNNSASKITSNILCVKFSSFAAKERIMKKKSTCKNKLNAAIFGDKCGGNNIFINDTLTAYMRSLLTETRKMKLQHQYKYLWVRNSSIYIRKNEGDKAIKIKNFDDLDKII